MIGSSDGKQYESPFDVAIGRPLEAPEKAAGASKSPAPTQGSGELHIDRSKDVPLAASALHKDGQFYGIAVDKNAPINSMGIKGWDANYGVYLHEKAEFDHMGNLMATGMEPTEAYRKAHDEIATPTETAYVRAIAAKNGKDPDKFMDDYKQHWRDVAKVAGEKEEPDRHPDAHTTTYGLDESELGRTFSDTLMHIREAITGQKQPTKEQLASGEATPPTLLQDIGKSISLGSMAMSGATGAKASLADISVNAFSKSLHPPGTPLTRAKELGYDQPTFHGTWKGFEGTKVKNQFYSTSSPELASKYAGEGGSRNNQVVPLLLKTKNYHEVDAKGEVWAGKGLTTIGKAIDHAYENKMDGVIVRNIHDEPSGSSRELPPQDIFITLKGNTARSWFANFDPAKMHINDLLASGFAVAVPAGTMLEDKDK